MKKLFRAESGLDAGGNNVINVTDPRNGELLDGVNVQYFIRENTVQPFDKTRAYKAGFAVTHERRLWVAKHDIAANKDFTFSDWITMRVDPTWETVNSTTGHTGGIYPLKSGEYILADSIGQELTFSLPEKPNDGDTVTIKDIGMYTNLKKIQVNATTNNLEGDRVSEFFSIPGSTKTYVYSINFSKRWTVHTSIDKISSKLISSPNTASSAFQTASGDEVYRKSSTGAMFIQLPKYANEGDVISTYDLDDMTPTNGLTVQIHPESGHVIGRTGVTSVHTNSSGATHYVMTKNGDSCVWVINENDDRSRWKPITTDYISAPLDHISIVGGVGNTLSITLPKDAGNGDYIRITNFTSIENVNPVMVVDPSSDHKILGTVQNYIYPKYKDLPKDFSEYSHNDQLHLSGMNYGSVMEFYFHDHEGSNVWIPVSVDTRIEHVDETNRDRPGVAPLASQDEVNKNFEESPRDDMIVTPKTLANKTATDTRRGIARRASPSEMLATTATIEGSTAEAYVGTIVTPKTLNSRQATEVRRGVAEVATQAEANTSDNDTHIITPKKLDARRATPSMAGIVKTILKDTSNPAPNRSTAGTGVYNWNDNIHTEPFVLTPLSLNEAQATEFSRGVAYVGTQSEANSQGDAALDTVIITPKKLDARRSTENMAGIVETATQAEVNAGTLHNPYVVTPKTLHNRKATETMWGLTEVATQTEVNTGTSDFHYVSPLKFKTWLAYDHFTPVEASGIRRTGNIWNKVTLDIVPATETQRGTLEVATQVEANSMDSATASDSHMITPKKLNGRRASESLAGIAEIASTPEIKTGTDNTRIVSPLQLHDGIRGYQEFNMSESNYGTGTTATMAETWVGNTTAGSTQAYGSYQHDPFVVSPRGLNYALQNYLPKTAKAVDSDKLDGLDSLQFLRSDADDYMSKQISFTEANASSTNRANVFHDCRGTSGTMINLRSMRESTGATWIWEKLSTGSLFYSTGTNGSGTNRVKMDINTGEIYLNDGTKRVYHEGHIPTPAEVGSYSKAEADTRFVNVTGDTMSGNLTIQRGIPSLTLVNSNDSNKTWRFEASTGECRIVESGVGYPVIFKAGLDAVFGRHVTASSFKVGATTVIETDAKINWNKLKSIPEATVAVKGIVKLNDALDSTSTIEAATPNAVRILKEMIDEKANITGSTMEDLKIRNWIRIGNVILRPNKETKSLDFIWTDEPL